jgi:hypothetical protein
LAIDSLVLRQFYGFAGALPLGFVLSLYRNSGPATGAASVYARTYESCTQLVNRPDGRHDDHFLISDGAVRWGAPPFSKSRPDDDRVTAGGLGIWSRGGDSA